jgi:hypothetical protein
MPPSTLASLHSSNSAPSHKGAQVVSVLCYHWEYFLATIPDQDSHLISLSLSQIPNVAGTRRNTGDLHKYASQKVPFTLEEI